MSASIESASRSTTRSRNCRCSTRNCKGRRFQKREISSRMNQIRNLPRHRSGVLFDCELREDGFKSWQFHEGAQVADGIVGDQFPPMKDDHAIADALDSVEFV